MNRNALILMILTAASAAAPAGAHAGPVSNDLCRYLIETARADFNRGWEESWKKSELSRLRESLYAFVGRLSTFDLELIRAYEQGKVSEGVFHLHMLRLGDTEGYKSPKKGERRVILSPKSRDGKWGLTAYVFEGGYAYEIHELDLTGSTADRPAVDKLIQALMVDRTSKWLNTKTPVHTATEYIRYHQSIPDECFPGDVVPNYALSDSDASKKAPSEALAAAPTQPAGGSANGAL